MNASIKFRIQFELLWWAITLVVVAAVLYPIIAGTESYPFLYLNIFFIIAFITILRYILFLKFTFLANIQWLKAAIILFIVPFVFNLIGEVHAFQTYIDYNGAASFFSKEDALNPLGDYIKSQYLLFSIGTVIAAIALPFRLLISLWRWRNKGTV